MANGVIKLALRLLPNGLLFALFHRAERRRFRRLLQRRLGPQFVDVDPGPAAPPDLVKKTAALDERAFLRERDPNVYFTGGYHVAANCCAILDHFGADLRTLRSIYELGCGSSRLLRHYRCFAGARLVGSDVNPEMIAWSQAHVPGIEFHVNELQPPLRFAKDDSFDLILAQSVFTHISPELQTAWLRELRRVLCPGGLLLCTVAGAEKERAQLDAERRAELLRTGCVVLRPGDAGVSLSTDAGGSPCDVFQTRAEVTRVFGNEFSLIDYIPGGLDMLVLQKPGGDRTLHTKPYPGRAFGSLD